jgi:hypothetical protein
MDVFRRLNTYGYGLYPTIVPPPVVPDVVITKRKLRLKRTLAPAITRRFNAYGQNLYQANPIQRPMLPLLTRTVRDPNPIQPPILPPAIPQLQGNDIVRGSLVCVIYVLISDTTAKYKATLPYDGPRNQIWQFILDDMDRYFQGNNREITNDPNPPSIILRDNLMNTETPLDYTTLQMFDNRPFNISINLFSNIIEFEPTPETCVPTALRKLYPDISKQKKDPIAKLKGGTIQDVLGFCEERRIRMIAYDIHGNLLAQNPCPEPNQKYRSLAFIYYNNHMYVLDNRKSTFKYLIEVPKPKNFKVLQPDNLLDDFRTLLQDKIVPSKIDFDEYGTLNSYVHDKTQYIANEDYDTIQKIINKYMFCDKINPTTKLTRVLYDIERLYTSKSLNSFFPIQHQKPAFFYNRPRDPKRQVDTIDKNKAYSDILANLPYLLTTDIRTHAHTETDVFTDEYALYLVKPETPNLLMPRQDIYSGEHVKFCKQLFPFKILERLECRHHKNDFKNMVLDLYQKISPDIAKQVIVKFIGTFETCPEEKTANECVVVNRQNHNPKYHAVEVLEDVFVEQRPKKVAPRLYNRKPIAIQIKDTMYRHLFLKLVELKKTDADVVQINTDSITFYNDKNEHIETSKEFGKWKKGDYKPTNASLYDRITDFATMKQTRPNNNTIVQGLAGNGKTYHIQNNMDLTDSIILTSKHSAIRQHREKNLNSQVIQAYTNLEFPAYPSESHIIVEECGILAREHWDLILKCYYLGKKITMFGDFNQLLPVDEINTFDRPLFLNMYFNTQIRKDENWRNNFTPEYYWSLINSTDRTYLRNEILKYSTKTPEEADVIIVYRNIIADHYNDYMLKYHNKTITDDNVPLLCKTNEYRKHGIYNNFILTRKDLPETITDEDIEDEKKFKPAYARTLYNMQGDETKSYYMAPEDIDWFLHSRMAYTLISRVSVKD